MNATQHSRQNKKINWKMQTNFAKTTFIATNIELQVF